MNLKITYQPTARELAKASSLFIEKKPFLLFIIGILNIFMGLFLLLFVLAQILTGFHLSYALATLACGLWLFGRRPFNEWLLHLRMKRSLVLEKPITIDVSANGIVWEG